MNYYITKGNNCYMILELDYGQIFLISASLSECVNWIRSNSSQTKIEMIEV